MNNRFILALTTVLAIATAVFGALRLTGGSSILNTISLISIVIILSLSVLFRIRRDWLAVLLIGSMWGSMVNLPLLDIFSYGFITQMTILALTMAERIILKRRAVWHPNLGEKAMLLFGALLTLQMIIEHPGSARLGGAGGLGQMIYYVSAGWVFFGARILTQNEWDEGRTVRWLAFGSFAFTLYIALSRVVFGSSLSPFFTLFWSAGFPMFAFILGWTIQRWMDRKATIFAVVLAILFVLAASLYSQFRACPYIAIIMIFLIAVVMRARTRFWFIMVGVFVGVLLLASMAPQQLIPEKMRRSLSTWRVIDRGYMTTDVAGEFGWEFEFRATLWNMAKQDIQKHPLFGSGWVFSFDEIISAVGQGGLEGVISSNALSGGFHNGMLTLAAKSGLPVALTFIFAYIYILMRFLRCIGRAVNSRLLGSVLVGTLVGETVVFLTNGGGQESVHMAVLLAVMSACSQRWDIQRHGSVAAKEVAFKDAQLTNAHGSFIGGGRLGRGRLPSHAG